MVKSMKKTITVMMLALVLVVAFAIPAFAANQSYQFWNPTLNDGAGGVSHASEFIVGDAVVTGSAGNYTVVIRLSKVYPPFPLIPVSYGYLYVDANLNSADGKEVVATKTADTSSYTEFTFSGVANVSSNLPISLQTTVAGIHNTVHDIEIDWLP